MRNIQKQRDENGVSNTMADRNMPVFFCLNSHDKQDETFKEEFTQWMSTTMAKKINAKHGRNQHRCHK